MMDLPIQSYNALLEGHGGFPVYTRRFAFPCVRGQGVEAGEGSGRWTLTAHPH